MKVLFHLAHPAHFHLFKNVIDDLLRKNINVVITYNDKDILEDLLNNSDFGNSAIKLKARKEITNKKDLIFQFLEKTYSLFKILKTEKPDIVLGTSIIISLASKPLSILNVVVNEDDFDIIRQTANLGYRFAANILCPNVCRTGKWEYKCIKYNSYHELSYLHPNHFFPQKEIVEKYLKSNQPFFLLRFAKLSAHHDEGIKGINDQLAIRIVNKLSKHGIVFITTERDIGSELNEYRLSINPIDIHHMLAFSKIYIGDSQTMAAEAGVLGTPFIRINDFVNRISYLDELENKYHLGWGIKPDNAEKIFKILDTLLDNTNVDKEWASKREQMLLEKIDYAKFLSQFIINRIS